MLRWRCVWLTCLLLGCGSLEALASSPVDLTLTCPVDGTKIHTVEIGGMTTWGRRKDLSLVGAIGDLYAGHIHSCPACHFAGTAHDFQQILPLALKTRVRKELGSFLPNQHLDALTEMDLALRIYAWQQRSPLEMADLALIASYIAEPEEVPSHVLLDSDFRLDLVQLAGQRRRRRYYQALTAVYIGQSWDRHLIPTDEVAVYTYLAGEMHRRLGQFIEAESWFKRALEVSKPDSELKQLIQQQLHLAQEHKDDDTL